jgi:hypothetical protein
MMTTTVQCSQCPWSNDIELTSGTNPKTCPECGREIWLSSGEPLYVNGEVNPLACNQGEADYEIISCKLRVPFRGTLAEAVERARKLDQEFQPSFGTAVYLVGEDVPVWDDRGI